MTTYPGATYRPIEWAKRTRSGTKATAITLHVTDSEATSQYSYFSGGAACSHYHVARNGHVEQYIDSKYRSAADLDGNYRAISIETQGADDKGWTSAQLSAIAGVVAFEAGQWGIPLRAMQSSATSEHGVGAHRLGCKGNFPPLPSPLAGLNQRGKGEVWSNVQGKVCPYDSRVLQVPDVLALAQGGDYHPDSGGSGGGSATGDDDMPGWKNMAYGDDWTFTADGNWVTLPVAKNDDGGKEYSALWGPKRCSGTLNVELKGVGMGHEVNLKPVYVEVKSGQTTKDVQSFPLTEFFGGSKVMSIGIPLSQDIVAGSDGWSRRLRFQIRAYGGEKVTVSDVRTRLLYWDR